MKTLELSLSRGLTALIDEADASLVAGYNWAAMPRKHTTYVKGRLARTFGSPVYLHRIICGLPLGDKRVVDHINHDGLDNRRANLRVVTQSDNLKNLKGPGSDNSTGVLGIYPKYRGFAFDIKLPDGTRLRSRTYPTRLAAAVARNETLDVHGLPHTRSCLATAAERDVDGLLLIG